MSAPDTNVERQADRHAPALSGIGLTLGFAAILFIGLVSYVVYQGGEPEGAPTVVDGRTGAVVATD